MIRKIRSGDYITTGMTTIGPDGVPLSYQGRDATRRYDFDWSDYFTQTDETVTITLSQKRCTATKTDGVDSASVLVSNASSYNSSITVTVAIDGGETFSMKLNINDSEERSGYGCPH